MPFLLVFSLGVGSSEVASWSHVLTVGAGGGSMILPNGVLLGDPYSLSNPFLVPYLMLNGEPCGSWPNGGGALVSLGIKKVKSVRKKSVGEGSNKVVRERWKLECLVNYEWTKASKEAGIILS